MTEAAQRKAVPRPASRLPVSRPVLWTGIAVGAFLAGEALLHRLVLPLGMPGFVGAAITAVLIVALAVVVAELTRRHHRTVAGHAIRHGKRGAVASARHARRHGGTALQWLMAKTAPRWEQREHRPLMFARAGNRPAGASETTATTDGGTPVDSLEKCCLGVNHCHCPVDCPCNCGPCDCNWNRSASGSNGGTTSMTASKITPERRARRTAAHTGGSIPSEWGPVVAQAADFEPEYDGHLLDWMAGQVTGMAGYAEALIEAYETGVGAVGIDPKGLAALHDVADAAAHAAETMAAAKQKFTDHYELPREFAANGGLMTHDGRWVTGEGA